MANINKNANIYDIDGNLINKVDESGKLPKKTIDEVEKLVDELTKKVSENPNNDIYKAYLNNAQSFLYAMYNNMSKDDLVKRISVLQNAVESANSEASEKDKQALETINNEIDKLKSSIETATPTEVEEVQETPKETIMDEYVPFEEIE